MKTIIYNTPADLPHVDQDNLITVMFLDQHQNVPVGFRVVYVMLGKISMKELPPAIAAIFRGFVENPDRVILESGKSLVGYTQGMPGVCIKQSMLANLLHNLQEVDCPTEILDIVKAGSDLAIRNIKAWVDSENASQR